MAQLQVITSGIQTLRASEEFDVPEQSMIETPIVAEPRILARVRAFASLESVNLMECFNHRPRLMQSVPWLMRGAFRSAVQEALSEIVTRGWKLLLLLPRMILFRPSRGGTIPRNKLEARIELFHQGSWLELLREGASCAERAHTQSVRRRRRQCVDEERQVTRALSLVHMGELSAARQALEGAPMAPGTLATLRALTDPERRPPIPREGLSREVAETQPVERFELNTEEFLSCLRRARRGAGPSGMTSDHLFPVLESERASALWGARRSPHAYVVRPRTTRSTGNHTSDTCSLIRTIFTQCLAQPELTGCMLPPRRSCGPTHASA